VRKRDGRTGSKFSWGQVAIYPKKVRELELNKYKTDSKEKTLKSKGGGRNASDPKKKIRMGRERQKESAFPVPGDGNVFIP